MRRAAALATLCVTSALVPPLATPRAKRRAVPVDIETSDRSDWYILQCYVGNELWCGETLKEILSYPENAEAKSRVDEILVPTEKVASTRGKKVYHKDRIIYPGYVFVKWRPDQNSWAVLTKVPKVANFVGDDKGMRNGIGDVVVGYKGAVTPTPLTEREVEGMLKIHQEGQDVGLDSIVDNYALGDIVAVVKGDLTGERGLIRSVKNDQLIIRLTGGTSAFDVPLDPDQVRLLTPEEIASMEQAEELAQARADAAAREAAEREARRSGEADYGRGDAGLASRRQRRADRKQDEVYDVDDGAGRAARRSRWDTMAEASAREGSLGFGSAVDKDLDEDEYTTAEDDPDDALLGQPSEADDAFFDSLFASMGDDEKPKKEKSRKAEAASDDDLLRSLLSDDGGDFEEDDEDESFASFLGSDEDDDLGDDAELLSILGIGGGGDEEPAQASASAPAVPVASSESYDTMKVPELKALLKEKGLKVGGKKAELVARLREAA